MHIRHPSKWNVNAYSKGVLGMKCTVISTRFHVSMLLNINVTSLST